jgi:hypothetical protein
MRFQFRELLLGACDQIREWDGRGAEVDVIQFFQRPPQGELAMDTEAERLEFDDLAQRRLAEESAVEFSLSRFRHSSRR